MSEVKEDLSVDTYHDHELEDSVLLSVLPRLIHRFTSSHLYQGSPPHRNRQADSKICMEIQGT